MNEHGHQKPPTPDKDTPRDPVTTNEAEVVKKVMAAYDAAARAAYAAILAHSAAGDCHRAKSTSDSDAWRDAVWRAEFQRRHAELASARAHAAAAAVDKLERAIEPIDASTLRPICHSAYAAADVAGFLAEQAAKAAEKAATDP